jgi:hypothetical protein
LSREFYKEFFIGGPVSNDRKPWNVYVGVKIQDQVGTEVEARTQSEGRKIYEYQIVEQAIEEWFEKHTKEKRLRGWLPPSKGEADLVKTLLRLLRDFPDAADTKGVKVMLATRLKEFQAESSDF